jgi:dTDP-4-dehydrorhamnose reductase
MRTVLVTGGKGQLATCISDLDKKIKDLKFLYVDFDELDITKKENVVSFFSNNKIDYCVNCAAYTAVDKAETEIELAKNVNEKGAQYLAETCNDSDAIFIQISTDFVFDGKSSVAYKEDEKASPLSVYGNTKLQGEIAVAKATKKHFILRTSWLYSEHGNNFLKTMLRLGNEKDKLNIVADQIGTPTYAGDLAALILKIIVDKNTDFGTYHYSNEGVASWYDFAKAIFQEAGKKIKILPIKTSAYPTPAKRPTFSVMDKSKIKNKLNIEIPYWKESMVKCLQMLK